jgi:aminoglycoside 2'-N-acetyltransferase I
MTQSNSILSARTEELDKETQLAIIKVCVEAHQEEDFNNLFSYVPSGGWHFLAYCGDQLVSHALVTTRWLQPEGQIPLKTAYVDAVSTLPTYQGQGYGSAVMKHLAGEIDAEYVLACLETEREGFYKRLGWQTWRGPLAGRNGGELVPTPEQHGIMVLSLSRAPALDLDSLLTIECQSGRIW